MPALHGVTGRRPERGCAKGEGSTTIAFAGGGSGGHVLPGIAVIERLQAALPGVEICWIGSRSDLERKIVSRFGIPFVSVPSGKLRRYFSVRNFVDVFLIAAGVLASLVILKRMRPALLFSKGGFVSVPPVFAARLLGIPAFTHDSDLDPGLATRINARFAERVFVPYAASVAYFPPAVRDAVTVTGNPVRREIANGDAIRGRETVGVPAGTRILLVLGGSQGARQINDMVAGALDALCRLFYVVHQMGPQEYRPISHDNYRAVAFLEAEYADVLAASDLVVARSGAGTLWELASAGKPSVLVPLGVGSSRGDQLRNAEEFSARGASVVLRGDDATSAKLLEVVARLAGDKRALKEMGDAGRAIARGDAATAIAQMIVQRVGGDGGARSA